MTAQIAPTLARLPFARRDSSSVAPRAVAIAVAAIALVVSFVGLTWFHVPANPANHVPALDLDFADLRTAAVSGHATSVQIAYFHWLGWTLLVLAVALGAAAAVVKSRIVALGLAVVSLAGLLCTVLATKGQQTWSQYNEQLPNVRLGSYLVLAAFAVILILALIDLIGRTRRQG